MVFQVWMAPHAALDLRLDDLVREVSGSLQAKEAQHCMLDALPDAYIHYHAVVPTPCLGTTVLDRAAAL